MPNYTSISIYNRTLAKLRAIAKSKDQTLVRVLDNLVTEEWFKLLEYGELRK